MVRTSVVIAAIAALCATSVMAAKQGPNVASAGSTQGFVCPFGLGDQGPRIDPNWTVSVETHGRPVLFQFTSTVDLATSSIADLKPVIDNTVPDNYFVEHNSGANNGVVTTLTFSKVYDLPAGPHVFGVQLTCQGLQVGLGRRWMTVYELP